MLRCVSVIRKKGPRRCVEAEEGVSPHPTCVAKVSALSFVRRKCRASSFELSISLTSSEKDDVEIRLEVHLRIPEGLDNRRTYVTPWYLMITEGEAK
jgi:hypothetical protein